MDLNYCVMILAIGDIFYKEDAMSILIDYFTNKKISYIFITEVPKNIDFKKSHPSWWKLLAHDILPNYDYIICWDLDLLPRDKNVNVLEEFNLNEICLAYDSFAKHFPNERLYKSFKYNGGLIGIPKSKSNFTKNVFYKYAPGDAPSYEQYYLNFEIEQQNIYIHVLPADINVFYSFPEFETARLKHFTCDGSAKYCIKDYRENYHKIFDTRINMIKALVPKESKICELGVFIGDLTKAIDELCSPSELIAVDMFEGIVGSGDQDGNNFKFVDLNKYYNYLINFFTNHPVKIIKGDTVSVLEKYPDEYFDCIYIDADHSYEGSKRDIICSYKKLKKNGFLMGHDYGMNMQKAKKTYEFGVNRAVNEFCEKNNLQIYALALDGCISFAIKKN